MILKSNLNNYEIDTNVRKQIEQLNTDDMDLYHQILESRGKRG